MNPLKDVPLYLLLFHSLAALAAEVNPEEIFRSPSRTNNIAVSAGGRVFVATENFLYQLNQRLGLEVRERTGPRLAGPCSKQLNCCAKWKETANVNKVLVVDEEKQRVLTCGTVRQGACKVRELHNISRYQSDQLKNVASLHPEASTVAFLVNGTTRTYLVTAVTPTGKSSRFIPDTCKGNSSYYGGYGATIFLRNPKGGVGDQTFLSFSEGAYGDAVVNLHDGHPVELQYVQGFQWQSHIYILLNANTSGPEIIRMDIKDSGVFTLQSFAQATLHFPRGGEQALRVLSSALIHPSHSPVFIAAILSRQGHPEYTALHFYNLTQFNGYPECHKEYFEIKNNEAGNKTLYPIHNTSVFNHSGLLSVSARIVRDWIVLFLGTDDGQLIKLVLDRNMKLIRPIVLFELKEETPIHHRVMFDTLDSNHLYLTSEKEVRRLKVAPCAQYSSCTGCLSAQDPYCGWCTLKKRCSFENECENSNHTVHWITIAERNDSCPRVTFKPSAIDYSLNNAKLFKIEVTGKLRTLIKENATCTMRKARNKEVICTGKYTNTNDCPCRLTDNTYTQLENEPDPVIIEASVEFSSLKFSTRVTVHNCYKIATAQLNNVPCSECKKSGCHWCVAEHKCTHTSCNQTAGQFCPQVDEAKSSSTRDLHIFLKHAKVLNDSNISLNCTFDGQSQVVKWINSSVIRCLRPQFEDERRIIPVNVVHTTNSNNVIDNPNNITVYSCDTQKPGCVFCTSERICTEPVVTSINPVRVSSSGTTTLTIVGFGLNIGFNAVLHITGMNDHITVKSNNCTIESNTSVRCVLPETTRGKKTVCLLYDSESHCVPNRTAVLEYVSNSFITKIHPTVSWASGGRNITISGRNLDVIKQVQMWLSEDPNKRTECSANNWTWICVTPSAESRRIPGNHSMSFLVSGSKEQDFPLTYHHNPVFYNFTKIIDDKQLLITVMKKKDNLCLQRGEVQIYVPRDKGDPLECNVTEVTEDKIKCLLFTSHTPVLKMEVTVGTYKAVLTKQAPSKLMFIVLIVIPVMLVIFIGIYCWATSRKAKQFSQSLNSQMELLESQFRNQIREGFVELQTEGSDMQLLEDSGSIPFLDYKHFAVRTFFPESGIGESVPSFVRDLIVTAPQQVPGNDRPDEGFNTLSNFLSNEQFLVTLIHILEQQKDFSIKDRCRFASFLTIAFHSNLVYLTRILDRLLKDLMDQSTAQPKLLLRGTETVVEKLLTNWVSLCMYGFLRESVGEPLFKLVSALKQRINLGPVDAISGKALYTLNEDWLLWQVTDFKTLKLNVLFQLNTEIEHGSDPDSNSTLEVEVLDCDTIGQAKEKIFEAFFNKYSYSQRFQMKDIDLELIKNGQSQILQDIDHTSQVLENGMTKLNTIGHYQVPAAASIVAIRRVNSSKIDGESENKLCHLISPHSEFAENPVPQQGKQKFKVKEMYLTKLLSSKVALHSFVESLFRSIWNIPNNKPPMAIRHVFDILHAQAYSKKIMDPDVLHIWKTNSLPLRFWINIIKNPQFVFDIEKTPHLDGCLSVIAQAFMDSFSLSSHQLGKHSPTNKVLYARDTPHYKEEVKRYYKQIADMASLTEEEMENFLTEESKKHENEFKEKGAMVELGKYIQKYSVQLEIKLENEGTQEMNEGMSKIKEYFDKRSKCGWE